MLFRIDDKLYEISTRTDWAEGVQSYLSPLFFFDFRKQILVKLDTDEESSPTPLQVVSRKRDEGNTGREGEPRRFKGQHIHTTFKTKRSVHCVYYLECYTARGKGKKAEKKRGGNRIKKIVSHSIADCAFFFFSFSKMKRNVLFFDCWAFFSFCFTALSIRS